MIGFQGNVSWLPRFVALLNHSRGFNRVQTDDFDISLSHISRFIANTYQSKCLDWCITPTVNPVFLLLFIILCLYLLLKVTRSVHVPEFYPISDYVIEKHGTEVIYKITSPMSDSFAVGGRAMQSQHKWPTAVLINIWQQASAPAVHSACRSLSLSAARCNESTSFI